MSDRSHVATADRASEGARESAALRLLLVADARCDAKAACDVVPEIVADRGANVLVVSPARTTRLHSLVSDSDHEFVAAIRRLDRVLGELRKHGIVAIGTVGDEDPLLAIEDALQHFAADEVAVFTTDAANENWREHRLIEKGAALGLPLSCIHVPMSGC
jgi:hypothetical protein